MLLANLDISDGSVKGAKVQVMDFQFHKDGDLIALTIKFDRDDVSRKAGMLYHIGWENKLWVKSTKLTIL